jgi:hypothetical protein
LKERGLIEGIGIEGRGIDGRNSDWRKARPFIEGRKGIEGSGIEGRWVHWKEWRHLAERKAHWLNEVHCNEGSKPLKFKDIHFNRMLAKYTTAFVAIARFY